VHVSRCVSQPLSLRAAVLGVATGATVMSLVSACSSSSAAQSSPVQGAKGSASSVVRDVDDTANGSTVHVHVGDVVRVTLHSTYWQMNAPSTAALEERISDVVASPPAPGRVPGLGAGTVVTTYVAHTSGTAQITAHRTSCGEALQCTPDKQSYAVTIAVDAS
jgi:hypothetical protein